MEQVMKYVRECCGCRFILLLTVMLFITQDGMAAPLLKPPHPGYPVKYHRVGTLDYLHEDSLVIGDMSYPYDAVTVFNIPGMLNVSGSHLKKGDWVGILFRKGTREIESVWLLRAEDKVLYPK